MYYKVIFYENDGTERITHSPKRPKSEYISKEKLLKNELSLKIIENDKKIYLANLEDKKLVRIYSRSATHIIRGLNKLKSEKIINISSNNDRKKFRRILNKLQLKQCPYCATGFKPKVNSQKYCSKECSKKARQDKDAERKQKLRKMSDKPPIGTIDMSPHRKENPEAEYKYIHSLKNRTLNMD